LLVGKIIHFTRNVKNNGLQTSSSKGTRMLLWALLWATPKKLTANYCVFFIVYTQFKNTAVSRGLGNHNLNYGWAIII